MSNQFYRHDNMKVRLAPVPGKQLCLTFQITDPAEGQSAVLEEIAKWIEYQVRYLDSALHPLILKTQPFIQSKSKEFLMIEFWSTNDFFACRDVTFLLMGRFNFVAEIVLASGKPGLTIFPHQKNLISGILERQTHKMDFPSKYMTKKEVESGPGAEVLPVPSLPVLQYFRMLGDPYPYYKSEDDVYKIERLFNSRVPGVEEHIEINGHWVLKKHGIYVDHDTFINSLAERNNVRLENA